VLFEALDDPDREVVAQAALALLPWASNAKGMEQISRAVLDGRVQLDAAVLDGLARWARPEHLPVALGAAAPGVPRCAALACADARGSSRTGVLRATPSR
jgi:hypothetical protein